MTDTAKTIVVGFDGSEGARKALAWGAEEARCRGGELRVVRAWTSGEFGTDDDQSQATAKALEADVNAVLGEHSGVKCSLTTRQGHAAKVLVDESEGADVLVVGSRGHGGFVGLLVGSVSQYVSSHSAAGAVVITKG